jgi:hypothetical protein
MLEILIIIWIIFHQDIWWLNVALIVS